MTIFYIVGRYRVPTSYFLNGVLQKTEPKYSDFSTIIECEKESDIERICNESEHYNGQAKIDKVIQIETPEQLIEFMKLRVMKHILTRSELLQIEYNKLSSLNAEDEDYKKTLKEFRIHKLSKNNWREQMLHIIKLNTKN